jgi:hypothetical protein
MWPGTGPRRKVGGGLREHRLRVPIAAAAEQQFFLLFFAILGVQECRHLNIPTVPATLFSSGGGLVSSESLRRGLAKQELLRSVWGYGPGIATRTVDSHSSRLRRKLTAADAHRPGRWVINVRGVGYAERAKADRAAGGEMGKLGVRAPVCESVKDARRRPESGERLVVAKRRPASVDNHNRTRLSAEDAAGARTAERISRQLGWRGEE